MCGSIIGGMCAPIFYDRTVTLGAHRLTQSLFKFMEKTFGARQKIILVIE